MKKNRLWYLLFVAAIILAYTAGWFADKDSFVAFMVAMATACCFAGTILTR
jgi:hypothetical protein